MAGQCTVGLGQGPADSWIESTTGTDVPCIQETLGATSTSWIVFIIAGIIIGSLQFEKGKAE